MSTSAILTNTIECEVIDKEIPRLLETVRQLRSRRNTLIAISRLPTEVLVHIFKLVQENPYFTSGVYSWTSVTRVSQSWRNISLTAQNLWCVLSYASNVLSSNQKAVEVFLERSGRSLPLHVGIYDENQRLPEIVHPVLVQLPRIRTLNLSFRLLDDTLYHSLAKPALLLETCHLSGIETSSNPLPQGLARLFNGEVPQLKSLHIASFPVNLEGFICPNLTHLKLTFSSNVPRIPITALLSLLSHTISLDTLELLDAFYVPDNLTPPSLPMSTLPNLRTMWLHADTHEIKILLSHLTLPPRSRIHVNVHIPGCMEHRPNPQQFLDFLGTHLHPGLTFNEVAIYAGQVGDYPPEPCLRYAFWRTSDPHHQNPNGSSSSTGGGGDRARDGRSRTVGAKEDYELVRDAKSDVAASIDFELDKLRTEERLTWAWLIQPWMFQSASVTHLRLRFVDPSYYDDLGTPQPNFENIFASFPSLTFLLVDGKQVINAFSTFISASTPTSTTSTATAAVATGIGNLRLPHLEKLCVHLSIYSDRRNIEVLEGLCTALRSWNLDRGGGGGGSVRLKEFVLVGGDQLVRHQPEVAMQLSTVFLGFASLVEKMVVV